MLNIVEATGVDSDIYKVKANTNIQVE